jgi:hypothetical protein
MNFQEFIFSEKRSDRIKRHLLFWFVWGLYSGLLHASSPLLKPQSSYFSNLPFSIGSNFLQLLPQAIIAYAALYLVVPMFIKRKQFLLSGLCFIGSWIIGSILNMFLLTPHIPTIMSWLLPAESLRYRDPLPPVGFFIGLLAAFKGNFTAAGFVVVLRYVKQWYLKEQRNLQLQKENTESQLQLLTARVHPRFLFNTLNNIYSKIQTESPEGSKMIMQLSDMLRYILNEGSKTRVPLKKELTMIQDYINLEKIRYGNQLDLYVSLPRNEDNLQIAPLIILPFVENSFKHGASRFLNAPWINLEIEISGRTLTMKLMNGKDPEPQKIQSGSGIGISNVKKRLELLYAGNYELNITDEPEVYTTDLRIELSELKLSAEVKEAATDLATVTTLS